MIEGYKNIRRLQRIVAILIKYGFGGLVSQMKIFPILSFIERIFFFRRSGKGLSVPVRIRLVLEELGPSFVKLGQMASIRADLLPADWITELKKLQDMVPPAPFFEIKRVVERSLKAPLSDIYETFDETPVASASIAQVHLATLKDGTELAVKVRRPNIVNVIESDVSVMYTIAWLLERYVPNAERYRPREVVDELSRIIHKELDLGIEAANINRFSNIFKDDDRIQIPHVYWDQTSDEVLTMERLYGTPIDEGDNIRAKGLDIREVAVNGITLFFKQIFDYGVFHADLHPGNIFVRDDGVIIYLDFGIVGRLDPNLRRYLASMLYYLVRQDYHKLAVIHKEMGLIGKEVDVGEFEDALRDIGEPIFGRPLENISISALLMKLINTARRFRMRLQPNLLLLQKSMVIIEGVGRELYPDINIWEITKPLIVKWMIKEKLSPTAAAKRGADGMKDTVETLFDIPGQARNLMARTINDELKIGVEHHKLEGIADAMQNSGKRVALGVITAAIIVGASLLTAFASPETGRFLGIPALGWVGYLFSILLTIMYFLVRDPRR